MDPMGFSGFKFYISLGQIIATSHDLGPPISEAESGKWDPLFQGKSRLVRYYSTWPEQIDIYIHVCDPIGLWRSLQSYQPGFLQPKILGC